MSKGLPTEVKWKTFFQRHGIKVSITRGDKLINGENTRSFNTPAIGWYKLAFPKNC